LIKLFLKRDDQNDLRTLGAIYKEDGGRVCFTLELPWLNNQSNISCIPEGTYQAKVAYSPKHKRNLYWLQNVPGRGSVEIHIGNLVKDTLGCILLGSSRSSKRNAVYSSRLAFDSFMEMMGGQEFTLIISNVKKESPTEVVNPANLTVS
jgi:hypothetical protein